MSSPAEPRKGGSASSRDSESAAQELAKLPRQTLSMPAGLREEIKQLVKTVIAHPPPIVDESLASSDGGLESTVTAYVNDERIHTPRLS